RGALATESWLFGASHQRKRVKAVRCQIAAFIDTEYLPAIVSNDLRGMRFLIVGVDITPAERAHHIPGVRQFRFGSTLQKGCNSILDAIGILLFSQPWPDQKNRQSCLDA